jgi:N-acetylglucosamine malate deacetylase 1
MGKMTRRDVLTASTAVLATGIPLAAANAAGSQTADGARLKVVVAGGHPDDPESGCGGTMALYAGAGHEVVSLYLTRGEAGIPGMSHEEAGRTRTAEAEAACRILGARAAYLGQVDGATEVNANRYDEVRRVLSEEQPDIVLTQWPIDTHRDHQATAILVYDAWVRMDKSFELYYYEVESGVQSQHFWPTHYVDIETTEPRKKQACLAHKSQNPATDFYPMHEKMQRFRGTEAGVKVAEAFVRHNQVSQGLL